MSAFRCMVLALVEACRFVASAAALPGISSPIDTRSQNTVPLSVTRTLPSESANRAWTGGTDECRRP